MLRKSISSCAFFFFLAVLALKAAGQENWTLASAKEGISIYTRPMASSKVKAIRVVCQLQATPVQLLAAIMDIKSCGEWVYHSKKNELIRQHSPLDLIYYSEVAVPWPAENRDYVVHIQAEQNPKTKVITVNSPCVPGYVPEQPHIVRISHSVGRWVITPAGKDQVNAEYVLEVDPMGNIPAWLTNMFATKGPLETFRKLKVQVQKAQYKKAAFAGITS